MSRSLDCTVVIPYKDRIGPLIWTLQSLSLQRTRYKFEVLIVDDGSDERPNADIRAAQGISGNIRVVRQDNAGAATARNTGWHNSKAAIIVFLDCDQIVGPNFIQNHLSAFHHSPHRFLQLGLRRHIPPNADIKLDGLAKIPGYRDERTEFFERTSYNLGNIETAWHLGFSHNMSMRRSDLRSIGGLNEDFNGWGFEDCELVYRFAKNGVLPILNPAVGAYHQAHKMGMTTENYQSWLINLEKFKRLHPTVEVYAQDVLRTTTDPETNPSLRWTQTLLQFEALVRLSVGRPIQTMPSRHVHCETKDDLLAVAAAPDVLETLAIVPKKDVAMIVDVQLDPRLKEVRMLFEASPSKKVRTRKDLAS